MSTHVQCSVQGDLHFDIDNPIYLVLENYTTTKNNSSEYNHFRLLWKESNPNDDNIAVMPDELDNAPVVQPDQNSPSAGIVFRPTPFNWYLHLKK